MIPYINSRLDQWGLWALSGRERVGYPKRSAFMRLVPGASGPVLEMCDDEAMQVNRAVQVLDGDLRAVVDALYVRMRSCDAETIARHLHCCRDTLYARLHRAHLRIMEAIQDDELASDWRGQSLRVQKK